MERGSIGRTRFGVLGPLQVLDPRGQPLSLGGPKARELLAALLLHPRQTLPTQRLVDWLWGRSASKGSATTLRTHVANVRFLLDRAGIPGALVNRPGSYALMVDPLDIDCFAFEHGVERGQEALALNAPLDARDRLEKALGLWRGSVLSDIDQLAFVDASAARLDELKAVAEEAAADADLALGRHQETAGRLYSLVTAYPYRERFAAQLMLVLYRCGRQAEALAVYESTRRRLSEELGIEPGPELKNLETAVLRQDPVLFGDLLTPKAGSLAAAMPRLETGSVRPPPDAVFAALRRREMVGRAGQLAQLEDLWRTAMAGGNAMVFISGPGGVGKSRLAAEVAHIAATDGAAVVVGRCVDPSIPYQPLSSGLRGAPAVQAAVDAAPAGTRAQLELLLPATLPAGPGAPPGIEDGLLRAVDWLFRVVGGERGLLTVVEDAERIDTATSILLRDLATRLPAGVMLLVCLRDPPGTRHPPLLEFMGDVSVRLVAHRLTVAPLSAIDLTALIAGITGVEPTAEFAARLEQHTGGNPFFATELVRDLGSAVATGHAELSTVPESVRDVLRHRLSTLPSAARDALATAAVLGLEIELAILAAVLAISEDQAVADLDAAVQSGFLVESGQSWAGGYAFPHELMRDAVYGEIPLRRRQRLHVKASVTLMSAPSVADVDVISAAVHLQKAGTAADPTTLIELSQRAATVARRGFAWAEAVHHAEAALAVLSRAAPPAERARAEVDVALLRLRAGIGHGRVITLLEAALGEYLMIGDHAAAGVAHSRLGGALCVHHSVMDIPRALEHFEAAERLIADPDDVFHLHRGRAQAAMYGLRTDVLASASDRAALLAARLNRRDLSVFARWGHAWNAIDRGDVAGAFANLDEAWAVARDLGDAYLAWGPIDAAALFATELLLDPAAGRAWCRRGLSQPRFDTFVHPHASVVDQLGLAMIEMGEIDDARRVVDRLPDDALSRRMLRFRDGDWDEAVEDWAAALRRDEGAGDLQDAVLNARWCAEALITLGRGTEAVAVLLPALDISVAGPQVPCELWIRSRLAILLARSAPTAAAEHLARCEVMVASGQDWRGLRGEVALTSGVVSAERGDRSNAETAFEEAAAVFLTYRLPWRRAGALLAWAGALSDWGRADEAAARRADARSVYRRLGAAQQWLRWADGPDAAKAGSTSPQRGLNTGQSKLDP